MYEIALGYLFLSILNKEYGAVPRHTVWILLAPFTGRGRLVEAM